MTTTLRSGLVALAVTSLLAPIAGCECSTPSAAPNVCTLPMPPMGCDALCSPAVACHAGTHCVANHCTAECSAAHPCAGGAACSADGTCIAMDGSTGGHDGTVTPPSDAPPADNTCASVEVGATLASPNVIVIVDQSGSMGTNDFPMGSGVSRWDALEGALMANPDGLIFSLQASVRWGMAWFHGGTDCPANTTTVRCALNNYATIDGAYTTLAPNGATPTGEAIDLVIDSRATLIDDPTQPTIFILATDGDPNTCADRMAMTQGQMNSVAAVTRAHGLGIDTYVISVGADASQANLQEVANAGVGSSGTPPAPFWLATDTATLSDALSTIVGGVVSCNLTLMGMIDPARACDGTVTLGGSELICNDPNGWHAIDATHIQLDGTACDRIHAGETPVRATFPCGAVVF